MNTRTLIILAVALFMGLGATLLAKQWLENRMRPVAVPTVETTPVVVAALEIEFGQKLQESHLKQVVWPTEMLPSGSFDSIDKVTGKIANQKIIVGEPVIAGRIGDESSGSALSTVITPNMRAISVRVNDVVGVAGFLKPGNRVDILAARVENNIAETETILQKIKVLAIDQTAASENGDPIVVKAVTLEVSPEDAEVLVKAVQEGTVQLTLRNPMDEMNYEQEKPPEKKEVVKMVEPKIIKRSQKPRLIPKIQKEDTTKVTIIRGAQVSQVKANYK